ncbi:MAG TPA: hypothetical protein VES21_02330 [Nocardioidaceae bacterium]|nr:hypothetical protein [Nocardioidaceae bacterium]
MERGVYFDGWYRGQHCYHPSLPARRLNWVEDLERYHATMLVWSALGGGSVSLSYLEHEAYGKVALRDRMYGVLNDSEFIAECERREIKVFGVVFEAQGWEFPAELDEGETEVLALNEVRGVGRPGWLGLREFGQDRYPEIWPSFSTYFPEGLRNSRGEVVTDLIEECASRALDGSLHRARWVECDDRDQQCYYMDRNNPVWREYLKAVIRIQIDAGVHGVQLDEASTPLMTLQYGGCFCHDCTSGFREHLSSLTGPLPDDLQGEDVSTFDYGAFLRARGEDPLRSGASTPLIEEYFTFQRKAITATFIELADYVRTYARSRGREVLLTGNLYNIFPYYNGVIEHVDIVVTEMRNVGYLQPEWFRYVVGIARGKEVLVVENPYGGVIPRLLRRLDRGEGYDMVRLLSYEASAMGANMTAPYGSWMGSEIEDSFSLPDDLALEIQSFLKQIDPLLSTVSGNDVAVLYDVASNVRLALEREVFADNRVNDTNDEVVAPFWALTANLGRHGVPFDVVAVNDDVVPSWHLTAEHLARYSLLILPGAADLPDWAVTEIDKYEAGGGTVIRGSDGTDQARVAVDAELVRSARGASRVQVGSVTPVGVNTHELNGGRLAVHLVNYDLDHERGVIRTARDLRIRFYDAHGGVVTVTRPDGPTLQLTLKRVGDAWEVLLPVLHAYAVVETSRT